VEAKKTVTSQRAKHTAIASLIVVLVTQILLSLRLIWSNAAYEDEGTYLWAGHLELSSLLHGTAIQGSFPSYFSGAPVIYPPIGAVAASIGGLAGARLLSLAFILAATVTLYLSATRLFGWVGGIGAAVSFALLGPTQFLSAYATYDAMALSLLALSAYLVIRASQTQDLRHGEMMLATAGFVLALADATKYAVALWDPVIIALAIALYADNWRQRTKRAARLIIYTAVPILLALLAGGLSYITGVMSTTLTRQVAVGQTTGVLVVLHESFDWIWPVIILAVVAVIISFTDTKNTRVLCGIFAAATLLSPLHQAQIGTNISLNKHVDFGAWFGAIAVGYAVMRVTQACRGRSRVIMSSAIAACAIIVVIVGTTGITLTRSFMSDGWPNISSAVTEVQSLLHTRQCPCLLMSSEIMDYYLAGEIPVGKEQTEITTPFYFEYQKPGTTTQLTGTVAYVAAIEDHYFSVIEDDFYDAPQLSQAVDQAIAHTPGYHLVTTASWEGTTESHVWYYEPPPPPLIFDQEFNGPASSSPSAAVWDYDTGSAGEGQLENYTSSRSNSYLNGQGQLIIAATKNNNDYQSARLTSKTTFTQGDTIEARIKLNPEPGFWPAWWLLGAGDRQEVDMMENYGQQFAQTTVWNSDNGKMLNKAGDYTVGASWHTYEVQWTETGFTFSVDGREYLTVTPDELKGWGYTSSKTMDMILNVAVGGIAGTPSPSAQTPVTMEVDWVRAWKGINT
jgi:beta-glucanase (GH16 family)